MITAIKLQNFQKHDELTIEPCETVTTITGPSNAGKSAIFRAIKYLVCHEPITGFQKHGTKETRVGIRTELGSVIRFKTPSKYGYRIDGEDLVACKTEQPEAVAATLQIAPESLASQFDPPFMLTMSGGEMAKALNRIVDLSSIDVGMAEINRRVAKQRTVVEHLEAKAQLAEAEAEKFSWVTRCEIDFNYVVNAEDELTRWRELLAETAAQVKVIRELDSEIADGKTLCKAIRKHLSDVEELSLRASRKPVERLSGILMEIKRSDTSKLSNCRDAMSKLWDKKIHCEKEMARAAMLKSSVTELKKMGDLDAFSAASECILKLSGTAKESQRRLAAVTECLDGIQAVSTQLALETEAKENIKAEMGAVCPTCGQKVNK